MRVSQERLRVIGGRLGHLRGRLGDFDPSPRLRRALILGLASTLKGPARLEVLEDLQCDLPESELNRILEGLAPRSDPEESAASFLERLEPSVALRTTCAQLGNAIGALPERVRALTQRFLESATPDVAFEVTEEIRSLATHNQASVQHVLGVYTQFALTVTRSGGSVAGSRILELGPGHSLLGGILLVSWGAERYDGVDPFPIAKLDARRVRALEARINGPQALPAHDPVFASRRAEVLERFRATVDLKEEEVRLDPERVQIHQEDAAQLSFPEASYDLVLSNAVLEHVQDLPGVARECARVLAPGGLAIHQIDLRDHRDFSRPRDFLSYSDASWKEFLEDRPFEYTNRVRLSGAVEAFRSQGLEVLEVFVNDRRPLDPGERESFDPEFREASQEDLEALGALFVFRRS